MGTTEQKGQRVLQSIEEIQQGINNLGGNLTDQTPFKDFRAELDGIYDKLPKTEFQEGTDITISNGLKAKLDFEKVYQEVEYIEGTGTQFINVPFDNTNKTVSKYVYKYRHKEAIIQSSGLLSNQVTTNDNRIGQLWFTTDGKTKISIGADVSSASKVSIDTPIGQIINAELTVNNTQHKYTLLYNGTTYGEYSFNGTSTSSEGLSIFGRGYQVANIQIFRLQIYGDNTLVSDFIPCYRKSDNVIGMYDKVNNKFYTNAGTGTFTKGADVVTGFNGVVGIGQSSQDTTEGTNLINIKSGTVNSSQFGVTTSLDGDFILVNGSRNDGSTTSARSLISSITNFGTLTSGETYKISIHNVSGTFTGSIGITFRSDSSQLDYIQIYNSTSNTKELTFSTAVTNLTVFFNGAFSANNLRFKLMLQKGTADKSYEQYSGGYSSPSPNWEQEIKCVAGKNLINAIETNKHIDSSGTILVDDAQFIGISEYVECKPNTTYSITFQHDVPSAQLLVGYKNKSGTFIQRLGYLTDRTFKTPSNAYSLFFYVYVSGGSLTSGGYVQLEESPKPTSYLPYNTLEEVVSGKNLADWSTISYTNKNGASSTRTGSEYSVTCSSNAQYGFVEFSQEVLNLKPDTDYVFMAKIKSTTNANGSRIRANANITSTGTEKYSSSTTSGNIASITFKTPSTIPSTGAIGLYPFGEGETAVYTDIMICESSNTASPYEPYVTPTSYQLSLGNIQFNAIGDYKDELVYDVENDKVYKNEKIGKYQFTGQENWTYTSSRFQVFDLVDNIHTSGRQEVYCNRYPFAISGTVDYGIFTYFQGSRTQVYIYDKDYTDADDFKSYLANNETYFLYIRNTPVEIPVTDTTLINQVKAWYNAHSNKGTTIITSNGDLPMIIKVRVLKGE